MASATGWPTVGPFKATIFADGANSTETVNVSSVSGTTWTIAATSGAHGNNALVQSPRGDVGVLAAATFSNAKVLNTEISNAGDNGVETNGNDTEIASNYIHDNFTNGIYHIGQTGPHTIAYRARIHDNRLDNNSVFSTTCATTASPSCWDGIDLDPLTAHDVVANNYVGENDIILFETDANWSTTSTGHLIVGNNVVNSVAGCLSVAGWEDNFKFIGNHCVNTTGSAVTINGPATNGQIENNTVEGSSGECIFVYPTPSGTMAGVANNVSLTNNTCINTDTGAAGSAIQISTGATNIKLQGNSVIGTNGGAYAIDSSAAATSTTLANNWPLTTGTSGILNLNVAAPLLGQPGAAAGSFVGGINSGANVGSIGSNSFMWGQNSVVSGGNSCAFGYTNAADSTFTCAFGGNAWTKGRYGMIAHASGDFSANGDSQAGDHVLRGQGTCSGGTVTIRITAFGSTPNSFDVLNLQVNNYLQMNHHMIIKDDTAVNYVGYTLTGQGIYRAAGGTVTLDATNAPSWVKGSANGATASAWAAPTIAADDTANKGVNVSWTNAACTNGDVYSIVDHVTTVEH